MSERVLTANQLVSGEVVYLAEGERWTPWIAEAEVIVSDDDATRLEQAGKRAVAARVVVEPYLIDVVRKGDAIEPVRFRERIRTLGPTIRTDLGKQADGRTAG